MDARQSTPSNGESVSDVSDPERQLCTPSTFWRCTFCGNVVTRDERPTRCFQCRRGESDRQLNEVRLFLEIDMAEVVGSR